MHELSIATALVDRVVEQARDLGGRVTAVHLRLGPRSGPLRGDTWTIGSWKGEKLLDHWPVERPRNWTMLINRDLTKPEQARLTTSLKRGRPLGDDAWTIATATQLNMQYTINPRGRPAKVPMPKGGRGETKVDVTFSASRRGS